MAFCETEKDWTMTLSFDRASDVSEALTFHVEVDNSGLITGEVKDGVGLRMSGLRGRCNPDTLPGLPPTSMMSFVFTARQAGRSLDVHLAGIAYHRPQNENPWFKGKLILLPPLGEIAPSVPDTGELRVLQLGDVGDTGTGSGNQT